ncbi:MAG TPA: fumarylacetoacetate hydrolase family protein [Candidatus Limnocylindrales bacterium]
MRFATIVDDGRLRVAVVRDARVLPLTVRGVAFDSLRGIASSGAEGFERVRAWARRQPDRSYRPLDAVELGPAVPDPGAIYAIGLNYAAPGEAAGARTPRPLVYGKLPTSVTAHGAVVTWDRSLTPNVDPEVELGVIIGQPAADVAVEDAMEHVFGFTCLNDISSRDPWLDGDQWLLGKSLPGFCPVGPWVVTRDELDPHDLGLGCIVNGVPIQDGRTSQMRFSIAEIVSYLSRHTVLRPGDLIATGTPPRLEGAMAPTGHLEAGDVVTVWVEGAGELTISVA